MENHYKYLHENPELSAKEFNTSNYVYDHVKKYSNLVEKINLSVIGFFDKNKKQTIAFRSELDALPILECTSHEIKSKNNYMHACGHDVHTAALLKLSSYIKENDFKYNIILIFQSKEETGLGSKDIVDSKILLKYNVKYVFGVHLWPNLKYDTLFSNKNLMFGSYELDVTIRGKNNHVSTYDNTTDANYASFLLFKKMYLNNKNNINHLGEIHSGTLRNISSDKSIMKYTIRFKNNRNIKKKISKLKINTNCKIEYNFKDYYPPLQNSKKLLSLVEHEKINTLKSAEDFGYYKRNSNILFLLYGLGKGNNVHTHNFNTTKKQRESYYQKIVFVLNKFK